MPPSFVRIAARESLDSGAFYNAKIIPGMGDRRMFDQYRLSPSVSHPLGGSATLVATPDMIIRIPKNKLIPTEKPEALTRGCYSSSGLTKERKVSFLSNSSRNSLCKESRSVTSRAIPAWLKISQTLSSGAIGAFLPEWPIPLM